MCGWGLGVGSLTGGISQALAQPAPPILPMVGNIRVTGVEILVNNSKWPAKPALTVDIRPNGSFNGTSVCALELASGIEIAAEVTLTVGAGPTPRNFGRLAFLQLTQYSRKRSPPGLPGVNPNQSACATSGGLWRLDGQYPYHRRYFGCHAGLNKASLGDGPNVGTEDKIVYETVAVDPMDRFQSWLIWEETDDNKPVSPSNDLKPFVLARIDWFWTGVAVVGGPTTCASPVLHQGTDWQLQNNAGAQVTDVLIGQAAGAPPLLATPHKIPLATPQAWVPC